MGGFEHANSHDDREIVDGSLDEGKKEFQELLKLQNEDLRASIEESLMNGEVEHATMEAAADQSIATIQANGRKKTFWSPKLSYTPLLTTQYFINTIADHLRKYPDGITIGDHQIMPDDTLYEIVGDMTINGKYDTSTADGIRNYQYMFKHSDYLKKVMDAGEGKALLENFDVDGLTGEDTLGSLKRLGDHLGVRDSEEYTYQYVPGFIGPVYESIDNNSQTIPATSNDTPQGVIDIKGDEAVSPRSQIEQSIDEAKTVDELAGILGYKKEGETYILDTTKSIPKITSLDLTRFIGGLEPLIEVIGDFSEFENLRVLKLPDTIQLNNQQAYYIHLAHPTATLNIRYTLTPDRVFTNIEDHILPATGAQGVIDIRRRDDVPPVLKYTEKGSYTISYKKRKIKNIQYPHTYIEALDYYKTDNADHAYLVSSKGELYKEGTKSKLYGFTDGKKLLEDMDIQDFNDQINYLMKGEENDWTRKHSEQQEKLQTVEITDEMRNQALEEFIKKYPSIAVSEFEGELSNGLMQYIYRAKNETLPVSRQGNKLNASIELTSLQNLKLYGKPLTRSSLTNFIEGGFSIDEGFEGGAFDADKTYQSLVDTVATQLSRIRYVKPDIETTSSSEEIDTTNPYAGSQAGV